MLAGAERAAPVGGRGSSTEWGYRPHLDGLRALAVYLVVLYHAGVVRFSGGFIGVDVFFVLSGYLVTQVLLRDLNTTGSIGFRRFYARRIRRLLPAAAVTLIVIAVVYTAIATPAEVTDATGALRAAALYVSNWFFIRESTDYFGTDIQSSPVIHFWSLSVEEQFYAAWPLLLAGLYVVAGRAGERRWRMIRFGIAAMALASLGAALALSSGYLNRAYYGTDTRAYELLAGALLACSPGAVAWATERVGRRMAWGAIAAIGAVVLLGTSTIHVGPIGRGVLVTAATIALILCIEASDGIVRRGLSATPVVYLGRISYGTYLWHWPVILVATSGFAPGPTPLAAIAVLVATGLASLSYQLLERPIRENRWLDARRARVVAVGLAASLVLGVLVLPRITDDSSASGSVTVAAGSATGSAAVPADLDWEGVLRDKLPSPECTRANPDQCIVVDGPGPHLMIMGDSNARMYVPMLEKLAQQRHLKFSAAAAPACPWMLGITYHEAPGECRAHQEDWYGGVVDALDPDVIIGVNRAIDDPKSTATILDDDLGLLEPKTPGYLAAVHDRIEAAIGRLGTGDRKVVLIEPVPVSTKKEDPLVCLSKATFLDECRFLASKGPTPIEQLDRAIAARHEGKVWSLDFDRQACPYLPICDPLVDGVIVRRDPVHLSGSFAKSLAPAFGRFLDDNGILG